MLVVEPYAAVWRFAFIEGHSRREAARVFGLTRSANFHHPSGHYLNLLTSGARQGFGTGFSLCFRGLTTGTQLFQ